MIGQVSQAIILQRAPQAGFPASGGLSSPNALFGQSATFVRPDSFSQYTVQGTIPATSALSASWSGATAIGEGLVSRLSGLANQYLPAAILKPLKWTTQKISQAASSVVGSQFRMDFLANGRLACAWAASTILKNAGLIDRKVSGCESLKGVLKSEGFKSTALDNRRFNPQAYQTGDVVFFAKSASGHGHVGVISKVEQTANGPKVYMVHNSTSAREVKEIVLNDYSRFPNSIYRT